MPRYKVSSVYGEGNSVFYVVDTAAPEPEQPAIVASYDTLGAFGLASRKQAESLALRMNVRDGHAEAGYCEWCPARGGECSACGGGPEL